jgi:hypothetical protein
LRATVAVATLLIAATGACTRESPAPARDFRLSALPAVSLPPWGPASAEVDALIQAKVAEEYARNCMGVWLKKLRVAPVVDSPDEFWFIGDYYLLAPEESRPTRYAIKGHCSMHNRQMRIYEMLVQSESCYPGPPVPALGGAS